MQMLYDSESFVVLHLRPDMDPDATAGNEAVDTARQLPRHGFEIVDKRSGKEDRKSTRLNSSHLVISYAVFCLKKKKTTLLRHTLEQTGTYNIPTSTQHCHHTY